MKVSGFVSLQRDPILAKQLFSSLFAGILQEMEKLKPRGESAKIKDELRVNMNTFLSKSSLCFPPFIACVQVWLLESIWIFWFLNLYSVSGIHWECQYIDHIYIHSDNVF